MADKLLLVCVYSVYYICDDFNFHVNVPVGDGYKFMTLLDSCDLKQSVIQPTHLLGHILDLILSPSDRIPVLMSKYLINISDHTLIKCSIASPCQVAHILNK